MFSYYLQVYFCIIVTEFEKVAYPTNGIINRLIFKKLSQFKKYSILKRFCNKISQILACSTGEVYGQVHYCLKFHILLCLHLVVKLLQNWPIMLPELDLNFFPIPQKCRTNTNQLLVIIKYCCCLCIVSSKFVCAFCELLNALFKVNTWGSHAVILSQIITWEPGQLSDSSAVRKTHVLFSKKFRNNVLVPLLTSRWVIAIGDGMPLWGMSCEHAVARVSEVALRHDLIREEDSSNYFILIAARSV